MHSSLQHIKVWDLLIRIFHWVLVFTFIIAYITEEDFLLLHIWAGYAIGVALIVRIVWGFIGSQHARFSDFVTHPIVAFNYIKKVLVHRAPRYIGHNPAGGQMIILLIASLIITTLSGTILLAPTEHAGPFSYFVSSIPFPSSDLLEEVHEFFANFTLFLVFVHILGVVFESFFHRENLILAMINGIKRQNPNLKNGGRQ